MHEPAVLPDAARPAPGSAVWSRAVSMFPALTDRAGAWTGTNGFRLMPADPMHDAPATAEVDVKAGGSLVAISYTWSHPADGPQDGLLVLGAGGDPGGVTAFWGTRGTRARSRGSARADRRWRDDGRL